MKRDFYKEDELRKELMSMQKRDVVELYLDLVFERKKKECDKSCK